MFKANWEKTSITHELSEGVIEKMVRLAYPDQKLNSFQFTAGGCANLNIKFLLEDKKQPLILRLYLRDRDAVYREQKLATLLKQNIPVPLTYYTGILEKYSFAITEFMPGISLRDLLLRRDASHEISLIIYKVGIILSKIASYEFPQAGFLDKKLRVIPHESSNDYLSFAQDCLKHETILSVLTPAMISVINEIFSQYSYMFPRESEKNLVHGDFDPANILVDKINGVWKVVGILDWEFAFSGSVLWDVANMLR